MRIDESDLTVEFTTVLKNIGVVNLHALSLERYKDSRNRDKIFIRFTVELDKEKFLFFTPQNFSIVFINFNERIIELKSFNFHKYLKDPIKLITSM